MAEKDHFQFIQLIGRLRDSAARHGQHVLADALGQCVIHASGGADCPIGRLILEDMVKSGQLPGPHIAPIHPPEVPTPKAPLSGEVVNSRLHAILKNVALHAHDQEYFRALIECEYFIQKNPVCPLHRYFHPDDPTMPGAESPLPG